MAQPSTDWPSEDEDFDAVVEKTQSGSNKRTQSSNVSKPAAKSVTVTEPELEDESVASEVEQPLDDIIKPIQVSDESDAQEGVDPISDSSVDSETSADEAEPAIEESQAEQFAAETEDNQEPEKESPDQQKTVSEADHADAPSLPKPAKPGAVGQLALELGLVVIIVGLGLFALKLSNDKHTLNNKVTALNSQVEALNANPQIAVQKQTDELIKQVGLLMQLPSGETPTVANVSDASKAKQQSAFFANAQNGDKVLMYVKAGEAILYRPSTKKIVLVAPLTFNTDSTNTTTTPAKR